MREWNEKNKNKNKKSQTYHTGHAMSSIFTHMCHTCKEKMNLDGIGWGIFSQLYPWYCWEHWWKVLYQSLVLWAITLHGIYKSSFIFLQNSMIWWCSLHHKLNQIASPKRKLLGFLITNSSSMKANIALLSSMMIHLSIINHKTWDKLWYPTRMFKFNQTKMMAQNSGERDWKGSYLFSAKSDKIEIK